MIFVGEKMEWTVSVWVRK